MGKPRYLSARLARAMLLSLAILFLPLGGFAQQLSCHVIFDKLAKSNELSTREMEEIDQAILQEFEDLFAIKAPSRAASDLWSAKVQESMAALPMPKAPEGEKNALTLNEIFVLQSKANANKAIDDSCRTNHYERTPGVNIGFCFGRAVGVHVLARNMKLTNDSIKKVWILGSMRGGTVNWGHHVATAVRAKDGSWHVVDPNYSYSMTLKEWYDVYEPMTNGSPYMLFATQADRFGPGNRDPLFISTAAPDSYHGFFHDLLTSTRQEGQTLEDQIRSLSERSAGPAAELEAAAEASVTPKDAVKPKPKRKRKPRATPSPVQRPLETPAADQ